MKEGDVVLTPLPQADGKIKNRPAIFLREMPPFRDILVCGVSTQVHQIAPTRRIITKQDSTFLPAVCLPSRLFGWFSVVLPRRTSLASALSRQRHTRLLRKLSHHLEP
jgi:mRNA interferase MazF